MSNQNATDSSSNSSSERLEPCLQPLDSSPLADSSHLHNNCILGNDLYEPYRLSDHYFLDLVSQWEESKGWDDVDTGCVSLTQYVIPTCFKQTTIVPVPENAMVTCLNYYRPVTLTSVAMKCFERLVMAHINTIIPEHLDPLQFAYRPNRSTDDAISVAFHTSLSHCLPLHHCILLIVMHIFRNTV